MGCGVPFCHTGCPLGNLIPDWNDLVYAGDWQAASEALHRTNNFPELTGKLCPAPCEEACVLALDDQPVAIKEIEMAIAERAFEEGWVRPASPAPATGRSVGVVGSGPAGLAAAQQLVRAGHAVTVYERDDRPGGLLRYGIPDYKLEKGMLDRRLEQVVAEGVDIRCGVDVGRDVDLAELRARHDAVVIAVGAQRHRDLPAGPGPPGRRARPPLPRAAEPARGRAPRDRGADQRRRPARRGHRRRRHQRRLPRQRAARGRAVGDGDRPRRRAAGHAHPDGDLAGVAARAAHVPRARGGVRDLLAGLST